MKYHFEIGKAYRQTFADGSSVCFKPIKRYKNGNWYGVAVDQTVGGRFGKPRHVTVFDPPLPSWQQIETEIPF